MGLSRRIKFRLKFSRYSNQDVYDFFNKKVITKNVYLNKVSGSLLQTEKISLFKKFFFLLQEEDRQADKKVEIKEQLLFAIKKLVLYISKVLSFMISKRVVRVCLLYKRECVEQRHALTLTSFVVPVLRKTLLLTLTRFGLSFVQVNWQKLATRKLLRNITSGIFQVRMFGKANVRKIARKRHTTQRKKFRTKKHVTFKHKRNSKRNKALVLKKKKKNWVAQKQRKLQTRSIRHQIQRIRGSVETIQKEISVLKGNTKAVSYRSQNKVRSAFKGKRLRLMRLRLKLIRLKIYRKLRKMLQHKSIKPKRKLIVRSVTSKSIEHFNRFFSKKLKASKGFVSKASLVVSKKAKKYRTLQAIRILDWLQKEQGNKQSIFKKTNFLSLLFVDRLLHKRRRISLLSVVNTKLKQKKDVFIRNTIRRGDVWYFFLRTGIPRIQQIRKKYVSSNIYKQQYINEAQKYSEFFVLLLKYLILHPYVRTLFFKRYSSFWKLILYTVSSTLRSFLKSITVRETAVTTGLSPTNTHTTPLSWLDKVRLSRFNISKAPRLFSMLMSNLQRKYGFTVVKIPFRLDVKVTKYKYRQESEKLTFYRLLKVTRRVLGNLTQRRIWKTRKISLTKNYGYAFFNSLLLFESRLDIFIIRAHFCKDLAEARGLIQHGIILVNGRAIYNYNYSVSLADIVSVTNPRSFKMFLMNRMVTTMNTINRVAEKIFPSYLEINFLKLTVCYVPRLFDINKIPTKIEVVKQLILNWGKFFY